MTVLALVPQLSNALTSLRPPIENRASNVGKSNLAACPEEGEQVGSVSDGEEGKAECDRDSPSLELTYTHL